MRIDKFKEQQIRIRYAERELHENTQKLLHDIIMACYKEDLECLFNSNCTLYDTEGLYRSILRINKDNDDIYIIVVDEDSDEEEKVFLEDLSQVYQKDLIDFILEVNLNFEEL